jgi:hypothetical protein
MSDHEPIFWQTTKTSTADYRGAQRLVRKDGELVYDELGNPVRERHPAIGHDGSSHYKNPTPDARCRAQRFRTVVRHDGNVVFQTMLTAAAADPNDEYVKYQNAKARFYGWFPLGSCPCALLANSELTPNQIVDKSILEASPCPPRSYDVNKPCPHALSEREARLARHLRNEGIRGEKFRSEAEKLMGQTREANEKLAKDVAQNVAAATVEANRELIQELVGRKAGKADKA